MPDCPGCNNRMHYNHETTKLVEFTCPNCHGVEILQKTAYRTTA